MSSNGRDRKTGEPLYRCAVVNRERMAAARVRHPSQVRHRAPRSLLSELERDMSIRHSKAQHAYNRAARRHARVYAERAATIGTDGEAMIPLRYLWHPSAVLVDLLELTFGDDLPAELRAAGIADSYGATAGRQYVNLAKCDRLLTRLGLHIDDLGEPLFSVGPPANPQRRQAVAA